MPLALLSPGVVRVRRAFADEPAAAQPAVDQHALRRIAALAARGASQDELFAAVGGADGLADLVAAAAADAAAREEQRALRRVATLVARGAALPEIFDAAAREAARVLGEESMAVLRYEPEGQPSLVALHSSHARLDMQVLRNGLGLAATVRRTGRATRLDGYAAVPIVAAGRIWGLIVALSADAPLPPATEDQLAQFAELVAMAIDNAETRSRVLAAAEESRRRVERDLHDGAQQRLVHTVLTLRLAQAALADTGGDAAEFVRESLEHAERATAELRELVHGIRPAALSTGGLRRGIESLLGLVNLPVHVDVTGERLPATVETTAYFVAAEALTNAVKHARATAAGVRAEVRDGTLELEVRDDGAGGADPSRGTGLVGLSERVAVNGGTLSIASPRGGGTTISVTLPVG
jgi:signal transduction histidine kinase